MNRRRIRACEVALLAALLSLDTGAVRAQSQGTGAPYTLLSREGRRPVATRTFGGQEMFALDELAKLFDLTIKEDTLAGGLTVAAKGQTIVLSPGQGLASVGGRLISLPAAPVREGSRWFVPVDFVPRALGPSIGTPVELRKPSRLLIVGEIRVPRVAGTIDALGAIAKLTLDVAPATAYAVMQDGNRLVLRFEADVLDATLPSPPSNELIQSVRPGDGAASIVIEFGPRFASFRTSEAAAERGASRIVIDVVAQTTAPAPQPGAPQPGAPQPGAPAPVPPPAPAEPPPLLDLTPSSGLRTIVIDAGHGGEELGARGPDGTLEKEITLSVARRLKSALETRLGVRVILTREADQTVGLDERAALANNNKADLFVSLHANASIRASAAGAEVFYLSLEEYGDQAQRVARGESEALPIFGGGTRDIEVILWEMAQARYISESAQLAKLVEATLRERVPMSPRAIQQAPFRVLVGANMPAVLVEMGFITNPEQEKQLASDGFQTSVVQALVESIVRYRDSAPSAPAAASPASAGRPGSVRPQDAPPAGARPR